VDVSHAVNLKYDGVGREARIGLNFTEVGTGVRASVTMYDRGHSATSKMQPGQVDWNQLFRNRGVPLVHTGGIMASLFALDPAGRRRSRQGRARRGHDRFV